MKNKFAVVSAVFIVATFLMTGVYQDDEFAEYSSFLKYRPDAQFYFKSPLGMQDMPKDYPPKLIAEEAKYDDFIHGEHWSRRFNGLALLLQFLTVLAIYWLLFVWIRSILNNYTDENNKPHTAGFPKKAETKH